MSEENREAIERVRAYGQMLKGGAPHQIPIGADILAIVDLAEGKPIVVSHGTADAAEFERMTKNMAAITAELDRLQAALGEAIDERDELKKVAGAVSAGPTQAQLKKRTKKLDDKDAPAS